MRRRISFGLLGLVFLAACTPGEPEIEVDPTYAAELAEWREYRESRLLSETGWVNLAGLFWLQEGEASFGSGSTNTHVFPALAPGNIGTFTRTDSIVSVSIEPGLNVVSDSLVVTDLILRNDQDPNEDAPTVLEWGPLRWWVIKRQDRLGIRLRNLEHPALTAFERIESYPTDMAWRIKAKLDAHEEPVLIAVPNQIGITNYESSPGTLVFEINGEEYRLDPTSASSGRLFVVFADSTTGRETYGGGRFLYADPPDSTGYTILDFNRAYNPPCAFSPYATCPRPPRQNDLSIPVPAGEKTYGNH